MYFKRVRMMHNKNKQGPKSIMDTTPQSPTPEISAVDIDRNPTAVWNGDGTQSYRNIPCQQNPNAFREFINFFKKESFDYVIELGTGYGGFSLFLHDQSVEHKFEFITYDWSDFLIDDYHPHRDPAVIKYLNKFPFKIIDKNIFENAEEINEILKNNKCLLLCDGGDKVKEFNIFAEYLTEGSYIMAHDYAKDKLTFEVQMQNTVWNWHEIQDSDIQDIMNTTNVIKSDYYNIFSSVAWISCIRKAQSDSHPPGLIE